MEVNLHSTYEMAASFMLPMHIGAGIVIGYLYHEIIRTWIAGGNDDDPDGFA